MKKFKELLKEKGQIWFSVNKENKVEFFKFAKKLGCVWVDGSEICPQNDLCGYHMGINKDMKLGYVSSMCWCVNKNNNPIKIDFEEILRRDLNV